MSDVLLVKAGLEDLAWEGDNSRRLAAVPQGRAFTDQVGWSIPGLPDRVEVSFGEPNARPRADPKVPFQVYTLGNLTSPWRGVRVGREARNVRAATVPAQGGLVSEECSSQWYWLILNICYILCQVSA